MERKEPGSVFKAGQDGFEYANERFTRAKTLADLLKLCSIKDLLEDDSQAEKRDNETLSWFHGKITRDIAENILSQNGMTEGLFLVRESSKCLGDYVLSLAHNNKAFHFQIEKLDESWFRIDEGPISEGLDQFIKFYQSGANGLPARLTGFCKGKLPPLESRHLGRTNILHKAIQEENVAAAKKILTSPGRPDVNAKNEFGSTALHDAAARGMDDIILQLLDKGANVKAKDSEGYSALMVACVHNHPRTLITLITKGKADPQTRCIRTGWVALHEAAFRGHTECVKALLALNAPCQPRNEDKQTPYDLAIFYNRTECIELFERFVPPPARTDKADWLHRGLDRQGAQVLLQKHGLTDGLFLVRPSSKNPRFHVLSLAFEQKPFNYEIRNVDQRCYYIDDGPFLESLEHVIQHYCIRPDGLPCRLTTAITPDGATKPLHVDAFCDADTQKLQATLDGAPKPLIPPRPMSLMGPKTSIDNSSIPPPAPPVETIPNRDPNKKITSPKPGENKKPFVPKPVNRPRTKPATNFMKIHPKKIQLSHELGQGEYGSVLRGVWTNPEGEKVDIAVKTLHEEHIANGKEEFLREAKVMMGLHHQCIVKLIGISEGPPMMLIQELVHMGSMLDFLLDYPEKVQMEPDLYLWAAQIANGMKYLEAKNLVHRDLAARNILLESKLQAKISDFGLSRAVNAGSDYYRASAGGRWPVKWYAPESVNYGTFSHASDVWSYGVTLWEMFSFGDQPYGEMNGAQVIQLIERGRRLPIPTECPQKVYKIMTECWSYEANKRPTFNELNKLFETDSEYASARELWKK